MGFRHNLIFLVIPQQVFISLSTVWSCACIPGPPMTALMSRTILAGRLSHRAYTVMPDAMRVKGEDMQERRAVDGPVRLAGRARAYGRRGQADSSAFTAGGGADGGVAPALWAGVGEASRTPPLPSFRAARLRRAAREEKNTMRRPVLPGPEALAWTRLRRGKAAKAA